MDDAGLRAIAAALARVEERLTRIEAALDKPSLAPADDDADLRGALAEYFGGGPFTAGTVLLAADENGYLQDALAGVLDYNATPHARAVQLGRLLRRLPGLVVVGGRRGAVMYRVRV